MSQDMHIQGLMAHPIDIMRVKKHAPNKRGNGKLPESLELKLDWICQQIWQDAGKGADPKYGRRNQEIYHTALAVWRNLLAERPELAQRKGKGKLFFSVLKNTARDIMSRPNKLVPLKIDGETGKPRWRGTKFQDLSPGQVHRFKNAEGEVITLYKEDTSEAYKSDPRVDLVDYADACGASRSMGQDPKSHPDEFVRVTYRTKKIPFPSGRERYILFRFVDRFQIRRWMAERATSEPTSLTLARKQFKRGLLSVEQFQEALDCFEQLEQSGLGENAGRQVGEVLTDTNLLKTTHSAAAIERQAEWEAAFYGSRVKPTFCGRDVAAWDGHEWIVTLERDGQWVPKYGYEAINPSHRVPSYVHSLLAKLAKEQSENEFLAQLDASLDSFVPNI